LELLVNGNRHSTLHPDRANYPNLKYPPFFANLEIDGTDHPELRIDGYVGGNRVYSRSFSSDTSHDRLSLECDDSELVADGSDATRLAFLAVDRFGNTRGFAGGAVKLKLIGPAEIVGDNPFFLADSGGVGAVWIKTRSARPGKVIVAAEHASLGTASTTIVVKPARQAANCLTCAGDSV
jgi:beta-galactosidase